MKNNRILSVCILIGMLLSGCKTTMPTATRIPHQQPLPNYVKHNQGLQKAKSIPYITVQLIPNPNNPKQRIIEYFITDNSGNAGCEHSMRGIKRPNKCPINESDSSGLFTTTFSPDKDIDVYQTGLFHKEVIIQGTATDGTCHAWKSDSRHPEIHPEDNDVIWNQVKCRH